MFLVLREGMLWLWESEDNKNTRHASILKNITTLDVTRLRKEKKKQPTFCSDALGQILWHLLESHIPVNDTPPLSLTPATINYSKLLRLHERFPTISKSLCYSACRIYLPKNWQAGCKRLIIKVHEYKIIVHNNRLVAYVSC